MNSRYVRALTLISTLFHFCLALEYPVGQPIIKNGTWKFKVSIYNYHDGHREYIMQ